MLRKWLRPGQYDSHYAPVADGFRALCVLLIAWFHIWQQSWLQPVLKIGPVTLDLTAPVRTGYLAVDLMLLLSSFLLFLPYARTRILGHSLPNTALYYKKRALRIIPSYYLCVLITFFVYALPQYGTSRALLLDLFGHLTFTHNLFYESYIGTRLPGVLWTLAVEVQFYLIAPLVGRAFVRRPLATWATMTAVAFFYRFVYVAGLSDTALYFNRLPAMLDVYANGMLAAWAFVSLQKRLRPGAVSGCVATLIALAAVVGIYAIMRAQSGISDGYEAIRMGQMIHRFPLSALGALFLIAGSQASSWFQFLFSNQIMRFWAGISYNLYIWHAHIALRLRAWHIPPYESDMPQRAGEQPWQMHYTLLCFAAALLIAAAVTYLWEKPLSHLGSCLFLSPRGRHARRKTS